MKLLHSQRESRNFKLRDANLTKMGGKLWLP
jgi:hypothetical protein